VCAAEAPSGFKVWGIRCKVHGPRLSPQGLGCRMQGLEFRVLTV